MTYPPRMRSALFITRRIDAVQLQDQWITSAVRCGSGAAGTLSVRPTDDDGNLQTVVALELFLNRQGLMGARRDLSRRKSVEPWPFQTQKEKFRRDYICTPHLCTNIYTRTNQLIRKINAFFQK